MNVERRRFSFHMKIENMMIKITIYAPGEARTHNLRIPMHPSTAYKYGALTDCATGAAVQLAGYYTSSRVLVIMSV